MTAADVDALLPFYRSARADRTFDAALQAALERVLVDPEFLFRVERDPENVVPGAAYRVNDLALASRLSFFLWSSVPDDELLQLAEKGKLKDPAILDQQVRRMIADERSRTLITNFAAQWLFLRNVKLAKPDSYTFPDWDDDLRSALVAETELFLDDQVRGDHGVAELLTARLQLPQRAAGQALRHPRRVRQSFPPRGVHRRQPSRRTARARQHPAGDVASRTARRRSCAASGCSRTSSTTRRRRRRRTCPTCRRSRKARSRARSANASSSTAVTRCVPRVTT